MFAFCNSISNCNTQSATYSDIKYFKSQQ